MKSLMTLLFLVSIFTNTLFANDFDRSGFRNRDRDRGDSRLEYKLKELENVVSDLEQRVQLLEQGTTQVKQWVCKIILSVNSRIVYGEVANSKGEAQRSAYLNCMKDPNGVNLCSNFRNREVCTNE